MDKKITEIIVKAIRKTLNLSSDAMADQIVKDLKQAGYQIVSGDYVKVC